MFRRRGQKSLYEVVSTAKQGGSQSKPQAEPLHPPQEPVPVQQKPQPVQQRPPERKVEGQSFEPAGPSVKTTGVSHPLREADKQDRQVVQRRAEEPIEAGWPDKPRMVAYVGRRVELSLSIGTIVVASLVVILLFIVFFRLGQVFGGSQEGQQKTSKINPPPAEGAGLLMPNETTKIESTLGGVTPSTTERTGSGSNRIVIMTYRTNRDLEPAKAFFDKNEIETEIVQDGPTYKLVTKNRTYSNPNSAGTEGYAARQKIIETGKNYKAPAGYEQFRFNDPYGEKVQ